MTGMTSDEGSAEMVALRLFHFVCAVEKRSFEGKAGFEVPDRKWILDTYAACLAAAKPPKIR